MTQNSPEVVRQRLSAAELEEVQGLVQEQPWLLPLPLTLHKVLRVRRQREFARLAVIGTPLLLLLYFVCKLVGYLLFSFEIDGVDQRLWWSTAAISGVIVITGLAMAHIATLQRHYVWWVSLMSSLALATSLYLVLAASSIRVSQYETYIVMLLITVVVLSLRLPITFSISACLAGGVMAIMLIHAQDRHPDLRLMLVYFLGSILVNGFVAWLLERQERLNFLQALLLGHEAHERELLNQQLDRLARQDLLSGLSNRRHFEEVLADEWERCRREKQSVALVFIDVDHFKAFNDAYGHPAGDACISRVGAVLSAALLRPADVAARYGGEEFVLLLPNTDIEGAHRVAARILESVDQLGIPHAQSDVAPHLTISIGVTAMRPDQWPHSKTLLDTADQALYEAKRRGRHRIVDMHPLGLPA